MDINKLNIAEVETTTPPLELSAAEIAELSEQLVDYHTEFSELYYRIEQAHWGYKYLQGLMLPIERKSIQPMAMALEGGNIQAIQQFIGQGRWQDSRLLTKHRQLVGETLGEADGVYIVDGSGFPKKGQHSVGVARQWCGVLGKVDNCQVVFSLAMPAAKDTHWWTGACTCRRNGSMMSTLSDGANAVFQKKRSFKPSPNWLWRCCKALRLKDIWKVVG